jgi:1,4-alpha-glucan branching enzyme
MEKEPAVLSDSYSVAPPDRYSAKRTSHLVTFSCFAPSAKQVCLVGDFNGWHSDANPMNRMPDGGWVLTIVLHHGHHEYYFLIDGKPALDSRSLGTVWNERGEPASLLAVR